MKGKIGVALSALDRPSLYSSKVESRRTNESTQIEGSEWIEVLRSPRVQSSGAQINSLGMLECRWTGEAKWFGNAKVPRDRRFNQSKVGQSFGNPE
ncbi:hypothetical protein Nepgr_008121 [Nepenthes gracilis]|uniref:Uncharacterized protein n=1 Tax=Nepenthes gracilis TaxID=150966 RepID=A0AAD3S8H8_NEPGR|nr:hypothetical protein Nepgr_008121 [Nepenthes gracilis]